MTRRTANNSNGSNPDAPAAAWGLDVATTRVELVRVARQPDGSVRAERRQLPDDATVSPDGSPSPALAAALAELPADEPLGVCVPDGWTMCRGLSLPRAAPAALEKMIAAQAEATLSAGDGRLRWTSRDFASPFDAQAQWVVLCAARRELVDQLGKLTPQVRLVAPRASVAGLNGASQNGDGAVGAVETPQVSVDIVDGAATLGLVNGRRLLRCVVVEDDEHEPDVVTAATPMWLAQVRQAYQSLLDGIPRERWPKRGSVRAQPAEQAAPLAAALTSALGVTFSADASSQDDPAVSTSPALATARLALEGINGDSINFARPAESADVARAPRPRRLAWLAAACAAGVLALYGLDVARASWLTRQLDQLRTAEAASAGIERRLDVDRYLERNVSPALPGLDAILAAAPQSLNISGFSLSNTGQFRLLGAVGSGGELDQFLRKLQDSRALTNVQLRSARVENNRWSIELTADATPMAGLLLGAPKPGDKPAQSAQNATNPQTPRAGTREAGNASEAADASPRNLRTATSRPTTMKTSTTTRGAP